MTLTDPDRRRALEAERAELLRRMSDWTVRLDRMEGSSSGDWVLPSLAGFGVGVMLFTALALYLINQSAGGTSPGLMNRIGVFAIAILVIVGGVVFSIRRQMRNTRLAENKRTRDMAVGLLQVRLREIEEALRALPK